MADKVVGAGRALRAVVASCALVVSGLLALLMLAWSCCSTPSLTEKLGDPQLWCALAAAVTAFAALPPATRRLRARGVRWLLLPFVLADLALCGFLASLVKDGIERGWASSDQTLTMLLSVLVPNLICACYVGWRVVLVPPRAAVL